MNILSSIAIVIFFISALPQIRKLYKNKTSRDISLWTSCLIAVGNFLMLVRAFSTNDLFFLVNYIFQFSLWLIIIILVLKYRDREPSETKI